MSQDFKKTSSLAGSRAFKSQQMTNSTKPKKFEGYDDPSNQKNSQFGKKSILKDLMGDTGKPQEENIEDQYVKGLQDEVKLLEYELKLLKDKETEEMDNFSHFFKFFNDGVPINDNIIAMKNLYQFTQKSLEEQLKKMKEQNDKQKRNVEFLKHEIENLNSKHKELSEIITQKENSYKEQCLKLETKCLEEMHTTNEKEPELKQIMLQTREKQNELMLIQRNEERERLYAAANAKKKEIQIEKQKKIIHDVESILLELKKEREADEDGALFEAQKNIIEEENENLKKKILTVKNDINMAQVKKAEMEFMLDSFAQDREGDFRQKRMLLDKIEDLKQKIENENKMTEATIMDKVREKEKEDIRKLELQIDNIKKKSIQVLQDRIRFYEEESEKLVYDKVDLQQKILDQESRKDILDKKLGDIEKDNYKLKIDYDLAKSKEAELTKLIEPLDVEVKKLREKPSKLNREIEYMTLQIDGYQKQVNGSIQTLLKKWEHIESMNRLSQEGQTEKKD